MPSIKLIMDGDSDDCWPDIEDLVESGKLLHTTDSIEMSLLFAGMESGKPSVSMRADFEDGRVAIIETSLECLTAAVRAFNARADAIASSEIKTSELPQ